MTHGLREVIEHFKSGRPDANRALLSITDGYNHPSVTVADIRMQTNALDREKVALHAIGRTQMLR